MKVKRYLVDDLPQAVQMIRSELGSDAVILNTKEIRIGGFLGMFRKKKVEVIAAVDEASKKPAPRPANTQPIVRQQPTAEEPKLQPSAVPSAAVRQLYSKGVVAADHAATPIRPQPAVEPPIAETVTELPKPVAKLDMKLVQSNSRQDEASMLQELRQMKEMMVKLSKQQTNAGLPESIVAYSRRLTDQGVEPSIVEQFVEEVSERLGAMGVDEEELTFQAARQVLLEWLTPSRDDGIGPATRVVHFVGPTGVGKTTTIAKLAADQSLTHRRAVGLITSDTYRIAAVDQLRTYADILNVPLEVVFSPSEAQRAFKKHEDRDLVFMDTAGRNYRNELLVSELNSMLASGEQSETILVLSMTHKYSDMKAVAGQFAKYGVNRLLLTKVDETESFGAIVNLVREFSFTIPYVTCGQTVPDDIRPFDPSEWVNRLLGEPAYA